MNLHFRTNRYYTIITVVACLLLVIMSCDDLEDSTHVGAKYFIKGEMKYQDVTSGESMENEEVTVTITYLDDNTFEDGLPRIVKGNKFEFGPLLPGNYGLEFRFEVVDESSGEIQTLYEASVPDQVVVNEDIDLSQVTLTATTGALYFITGKAIYPDPLSNDTITDAAIAISLTGEGKNLTASGSSFKFGPLPVGSYDLRFELTKEDVFTTGNTIRFTADTSATISSESIDLGDVVLVRVDGNTHFISGSLNYTDLFTNVSGGSFSNLSVEVTPVDASGFPIGVSSSKPLASNFFNIGPLDTGRYELTFVNSTTDNEFAASITYDTTKTYTIADGADTLDIGRQALSWRANTALVLQITDSLDNPISGGVCLFNNSDFLELNLPTCGGQDSVTSNKDGRLLFQNLAADEYFFNVASEIGSVLLNNHDSIDETKSVPLMADQLNQHTIKIYKD